MAKRKDRGGDNLLEDLFVKPISKGGVFADLVAKKDRAEDEATEGVRNLYFPANAFCPTGQGGGVDPSCSPGGSTPSSAKRTERLSKAELDALPDDPPADRTISRATFQASGPEPSNLSVGDRVRAWTGTGVRTGTVESVDTGGDEPTFTIIHVTRDGSRRAYDTSKKSARLIRPIV